MCACQQQSACLCAVSYSLTENTPTEAYNHIIQHTQIYPICLHRICVHTYIQNHTSRQTNLSNLRIGNKHSHTFTHTHTHTHALTHTFPQRQVSPVCSDKTHMRTKHTAPCSTNTNQRLHMGTTLHIYIYIYIYI